jgi:hypothetical protein
MKRDRLEDMQLPEGFRILIRHLRRGVVIFKSLKLVFLGCAVGVFIFHGGIAWVITSFILGLVCELTALLHVGRRYISAWKVAENPQIVFWGHSVDRQGQATDKPVIDSKNLKLHLRDGTQLEVEAVSGTGMSQEQLRDIILWLRQRNPSMRWGDYDKPC